MLGAEQRVELATLRINLRAIDAEIGSIRRESRRYRQMNFGLDIKEIQLTGLQDQREASAKRVQELEELLELRPPRKHRLLALLLLPLGICSQLQQALAPAMPAPVPEGRVVPLPVEPRRLRPESLPERERLVAAR